MGVSFTVEDGYGTENVARVTERGQLVVSNINFEEAYNAVANVNNQAFNLVTPDSDKQFVITAILLYANKNVGTNDATIEIYEAEDDNDTTVAKSILQVEMPKQTTRDIVGLNLIVTEGRWVNIKTDDNTIYSTIFGYYVDAAES